MNEINDTCLIRADGISVGPTKDRAILEGVSFSSTSGKLLWIRGTNGVGKSTLLRAILGQAHILSGNLDVMVSMKQMGYLPQLQNRFFHLPVTLRDVIAFSSDNHLDEAEIFKLGLLQSQHMHLAWNTASGGERKRTLLTRILLQKPDVLILDEPLSQLDEQSYAMVLQAIHGFLTNGPNKAAVVVEHEAPPTTLDGILIEDFCLTSTKTVES